MELVNALLLYFGLPETQYAVLLPGAFTLLALCYLRDEERTKFFVLLVFSTITCFMSARWKVSEEMRQLFILPCAFFSVCAMLWARIPVSAPAAYAATFLSMWTVDMAMATQLVYQHETTWLTFYFGVGGAGYQDALCLLPPVASAVVHYGTWRQRHEAARPLDLVPRIA